jgi:1-acyl-sn-glycerol-3-phosphate acyltransferase
MLLSALKLAYIVVALLDLFFFTTMLYILSYLPKKWLANWYPRLFRYWCKIFIRALGIELKAHQQYMGKLPELYILISNHPSVAEDLCMSYLFKAKFLAKIELKNWWFVGRISTAAGTLYVKREDKSSRQEASDALMATLKAGQSVGVYPEGGCKGRRVFLPFRYGAFELSKDSGVPILPVFIYYEAQEDLEWQNDHLLYKLWTILTSKNGTAHYYIFDLVYPDKFESKEALCEYVQNLYLAWQQKYLV